MFAIRYAAYSWYTHFLRPLEQKFSALMVERGVLGFPKHNLAPSSKNKRRDICLSAFHAQGCRP